MIRILLVTLLLVGCGDELGRKEKHEKEWSNAKPLKVERYIDESNYYQAKVSTFIIDDHKIIVYHSSYGGRLFAIPINKNEKIKVLESYIDSLEQENQLLGSLLAEKE
jgi:hypothetical protein